MSSTKADTKQLHADLKRFEFTEEDLRAGLGDPMWRLNNLYKIVDKKKNVVTFRMNTAQKKLIANLHTRNVVLKARKMGFSTLIQLFMLDTALFSPNERCVVIAQDINTSEAIFRDVIKFAYDSLPEVFKIAAPTENDPSKSKIIFSNKSLIEVRTTARGNTPTILHVSEFGKIAAKDPGKAREIISGAITAVPEDGLVFVESTAEAGEEGAFYDMVATARRLQDSGKRLWKLEFKFHFFGWWEDPVYQAPAGSTPISPREHEAFDDLEALVGREITIEQRSWYILTRDNTYSGDQDIMYQEFPGTPEEAFKISLEGAYFTEQFRNLRKTDRITTVPYDPAYPVSSFWDIGGRDCTAIWLIQAKPSGYAVINFEEATGEPFNFFVTWMQGLGYFWGAHYIPHDATQIRQQGLRVTTAEEMLMELAPGWQFYVVPKTPDKTIPIQQARNLLPMCTFDASACKKGLRHLETYRKEFDTRAGVYRSTPKHGPESNGADAFLQFCQSVSSGAFGSVTSMMGGGGAGDFGNNVGGWYQPVDLDY